MILLATIVCIAAGIWIVSPLVDRRWPNVGRSVVVVGSAMVVPLLVMLLAMASFIYAVLHPDCPPYEVCGPGGLIQLALVMLGILTAVGLLTFGLTSAYMRFRINRPEPDVQDADTDTLS
jgi:hypothetical protein